MSSQQSSAVRRTAGPLLRSGDTTDAIIDAIEEDNPDIEVVVRDHAGYIRVEGDDGLILRRETAQQSLGRPFKMQEIEILMAGYSGLIEVTEDYARWYFRSPPAATPTEGSTPQ